MFSWRVAETCNAIRSYEKRKASKKKRKDLAVLADAATESRFLAKLSSSNVKAVALTRAPEY